MEPRVLVLTDNPLLRGVLVAALEASCRAQVWVVSDADQGLALALQHKPDLILMDLQTPGLDPLEACAAIAERSDLMMTRLWIVTSPSTSEATIQTLTCYADRLIRQPLSAMQLSEEIRTEIDPLRPRLEWLGE
jgi:two-component system, NarL family, response regulator DesR